MITDHIMASIADLAQEVSQYFASLQWERLGAMLSYNPSEPLLFSSGLFLFLFLALTLVYMALRKALTPRILFLTLFSYYFFYKSSGMYFLLLVLVTVTDFYIAKGVSRLKEKADEQAERERRTLGEEEATPHYGRAKGLLALSLAIDLGLLCYFKYTNFFAGMVTQMIGSNFQPWDIFLPVGISFYTFKTISYVVDVYRGKMKPMESLLDYAFYVSFFPTLLAGPIVRATDFARRSAVRCRSATSSLAWAPTSCSSDWRRSVSSPTISRKTSSIAFSTIPRSSPAVRCSWVSMATPYRSIATSRAIAIWR